MWSGASANPGDWCCLLVLVGVGTRKKGLESGRGVVTTLLVVSVLGLVLAPVLTAAFAMWELEVGRLVLVLVLGSGLGVGPRR